MTEPAKPLARPKLALPRREFISGRVHYQGPFVVNGNPTTLCGATGLDKRQVRVRKPVTCSNCDALARWVWQHRVGYGYGETQQLVEQQQCVSKTK